MFGKKKTATLEYDKNNWKPAIKASICTGEQTAGFLHKQTGQFREDMLIRGAEDLHIFREKYGIEIGEELEKIY